MSTLTIFIVALFVLGYLSIALESVTKINKAAVALLMFVGCWTLFMFNPVQYPDVAELLPSFGNNVAQTVSNIIERHLGSTATTLFFLMGAMTIVELVDQNGGFNFVRDTLQTHSKRKLLWRIAFMTFFLSAILDNLTTSIVMIMILRKLVSDKQDRLIYAALVVISANSGGAFSPIGDVTTIMLWNKGVITSQGVITEIFIPSLVSMLIPAYILSLHLKGNLTFTASQAQSVQASDFTASQRKIIFFLGVGGDTIFFFLGILMAVACLETIGVLELLGRSLDTIFEGNHYLVTGIIGVLSSIVDNVPLVAGCMGMYPMQAAGDMALDGVFWQLLAYCAGVGGSMLIIGSAAGVVVMGLEKISFGWYMKKITWIAFVGYVAGIGCYWLIRNFLW